MGYPRSCVCYRVCIFFIHSKFYQILSTVLWCFPMFPNAHTKSVSDVTVKFLAEFLHTTYLEVVNPTSDKLIKFLNLAAVCYQSLYNKPIFQFSCKIKEVLI